MSLFYYDRQRKPLPGGVEDFARLTEDHDYVVLHEDIIGPYHVHTVWTGLDMSPTLIMMQWAMRGMPNPLPIVFATMVQPLAPVSMTHFLFGAYLEKFVSEDQAAEEHAKAVAWFRSNLELRA